MDHSYFARLEERLDRREERLDRRFDRLEEKIDHALELVSGYETRLGVDEARTEVLDRRIGKYESRLNVVEEHVSKDRGVQGFRRYLLPVVGTLIGSAWWVPELWRHSGHT